MGEPYPGGYQPYPGDRPEPDQPDYWPVDDWFRPQPDAERGPVPFEVSGERGRGGRHRHAAAPDPQGDETGGKWPLNNLNWALISRNWALIAGIVFFVFDTFLMADGFARPVGMASRILVIFIWLVSLVAVALLWLRGSSRFSIQNPFVRGQHGAHHR
jgi:hypothetical protein